MAYAYQKTVSDLTVIFGAREQLASQFDFGTDWTEIRIGMFWGLVALNDNNAAPSTEDVAISSVLDRIFFGIKDNSQNCPGVAGSLYIGLSNRSTNHSYVSTANGSMADTFNGRNMGVIGYKDTTPITGASTDVSGLSGVSDPSPTSGYAAFTGVKFVLLNRGLSNQQIKVSAACSPTGSPVSGTDYSAANLRTYLSAFAGGSAEVTLDWNDGATAYAIPDSWFLRNPFFNARVRVSCMNAIKVSP